MRKTRAWGLGPGAWTRAACVVAALFVLWPAAAHADGPDLTVTPLQRDGQVFVSFELSDGLSPDVRDAIQSGLPTTFSYEIELRQDSAIFDRTIAAITITASVRFDNLTRRYQMSRAVDGRVEDARPTEDQNAVREWMTRFDRVPVSTTAALETNGEYYVRVRALARPRSTWLSWLWNRSAVLGNAKFTFIP
ncbi:MAG TPA: DUF4390 domain-containing protein [Vicinamibacterales bacterium]|jgi:hypothetical protein|nr:DUF4390 domain-containing protein [Vicinamibacterales bacterium]